MCCLMITTVWNVVMLRSNLIHHDGRWTRMISTTMIFSKCLFYCDTCTYGCICGTCIWNCFDDHVWYSWIAWLFFSPSLSWPLFRVQSLSLSSKYPSISLFFSVKYLSLSFSLSNLFFSDCTQIWLAFHLFCEHLFTKTYTFSNKNLNESMKCKLLLSPMCKNQDG